ncbi:MAG: ATP-binding protein [Cyanobacteria bacterium J06627_28]
MSIPNESFPVEPMQSGGTSESGSGLRSAAQSSYSAACDILAGGDSQLGSRYTILIVDDSEADRTAYRRFAMVADAQSTIFLECDCGEDGLALCQQHLPDLILLDYLLPDLNGVEFVQTLKELMQPVPPVIMLTGEGNERVAVEAMKAGARDYLVKRDLSAQTLTQAIRRVITQQALQRTVSRRERQQRLISSIALRIHRAENLAETLSTVVDGTRQLLDCDRTAVYRFNTDMSGTILAESVLPQWTASIGAKIEDSCFQQNGAENYLQGHKTVISDIYNSSLTTCHVEMLSRFEVRANLVVPIVVSHHENGQRQLWGLLLAHHCRDVRNWQPDELALLDDLAVQLAIAIRHAELVGQLKTRAGALSTSNRRLSETAKMLQERNKELDEFAYIASHDLRAPLRAMANLASWLEEDISDKIPPESREQLVLIQSRAQRLDDFITGLLEYSRAGRKGLTVTSVNVTTLIDKIIHNLVIPDRFTFVKPSENYTIRTQELLLQQVLTNLISNAIKHHDTPEGTVRIEVISHEGLLSFSISDDGPGIAPEYHKKIFGVFQTLTSRDVFESTGVGLSIVKKLVERQGGQISVQSELGQGSTFTFTWPEVAES